MGLPDGMTASIKVAQLAQAEILERAMTKEDIMLERIGSRFARVRTRLAAPPGRHAPASNRHGSFILSYLAS